MRLGPSASRALARLWASVWALSWALPSASGRRDEGCAQQDFLICVARLKFQGAPFDKNVLNVVFSVDSEAKLGRTCSAYADVLPCFRDRIAKCGSERQVRMLEEVGRMLMFFCSPFSKARQELFLQHGPCIKDILQLPASTECAKDSHRLAATVQQCKDACLARQEFLCMMKIWISEQSLCTLMDIERKCSVSAGQFYADLQHNVFNTSFPIICDVELPPLPSTTQLPSLASTTDLALTTPSWPLFTSPPSTAAAWTPPSTVAWTPPSTQAWTPPPTQAWTSPSTRPYTSAQPIYVTRRPILSTLRPPMVLPTTATPAITDTGEMFVTITPPPSTTRRRPWYPTIIPLGGLPSWPFPGAEERLRGGPWGPRPPLDNNPPPREELWTQPPEVPWSSTGRPAPTRPPPSTLAPPRPTERWLPWYLRGRPQDAAAEAFPRMRLSLDGPLSDSVEGPLEEPRPSLESSLPSGSRRYQSSGARETSQTLGALALALLSPLCAGLLSTL